MSYQLAERALNLTASQPVCSAAVLASVLSPITLYFMNANAAQPVGERNLFCWQWFKRINDALLRVGDGQ